MACSADGFLARGPDDDMTWTGPADKRVFRVLTGVGGMCAVGTRTWELMPSLEGRQVIPISQNGYTLARLWDEHPDTWLLGGPTVARAALRLGLVSEFHLCRIMDQYLRRGVHLADIGMGQCSDGRRGGSTSAMSTDLGSWNLQLDVYRMGPGH